MKKLLYFLAISLIGFNSSAQSPSACFTSGNDVSFTKVYSSTRGITKGDFDNDGKLDVAVTFYGNGYTNRYGFLKGVGNGKFSTLITGGGGQLTTELDNADFNNDGNLDLAVTCQTGVTIYFGQGNGVFDSITTYSAAFPKCISIADMNEDGAEDIVYSTGAVNQILLGSVGTPGTFTTGATFSSTSIVSDLFIADVNGDNHLDVVTSYTSGVSVCLNNPGSLGNLAAGVNYSTGASPGVFSLTVCDLDNDGDKEVIATNKSLNQIAVLFNNGAGVMSGLTTYATGSSPEGIDFADINGDGFKDIMVVNNASSTMSIFYGAAGGILSLNQTTQCPGAPRCLLTGLFNADTKIDIITGQLNASYINSFIGNASNNYVLPDLFTLSQTPGAIHSNDFNNDGNKDLVYTFPSSNQFSISLGNGAGVFTPGANFATGNNPRAIISGDLNNDGKMDVVTADSASNQISVFYGNGAGGFSAATAYPAGTGPVAVKLGDLNGDSFLDIAVVNQSTNAMNVLLSSSGTSFSAPASITTGNGPIDLVILNIDGDTDLDIVTANKTGNNITRCTNSGTGTFTAAGNTLTTTGPVAMDGGDIDGDGDNDLVILGSAGYARLYGGGTGTFVNGNFSISNPSPAGPVDISLVDGNQDGKKDLLLLYNENNTTSGSMILVVGNAGTNLSFAFNSDTVRFATEVNPKALTVNDFNNDSRIDVAVTNKLRNQLNIHYNTTPIITAGGPTSFCNGNSVVLSSTSALQYSWTPTLESTQSISATTSGSYYATTTSSWSNWCSSSSNSIAITVTPGPSAPTITNSGGTTVCEGNTVTLTSSETTGNQWYKDGVAITGATNQTYVASSAGSYTVTYTSGGCTSPQSSAIVLTFSQTPVITAMGPTTFCAGGSVVLHSNVASNLSWSPGGATSQDITVTSAGTYTATNSTPGCPNLTSNSITVTVGSSLSTPSITPAGPITICAGNTVTLTSSSSSNNVWSTGANTQSIVVSTPGNYYVHLDDGSCTSPNSNTVSVTVNPVPPTPTITAGGSTTFCAGGSVTLTSSAASGNTWTPGGANTQSISATTSGSYTVTVTSGGCSATSAPTVVTVNAAPATPTITASGPTTFCAGGSVTLTAPASSSYLWSNGALTQSIVVNTSGTYTVQVTNATGCQSAVSATTTVTVNPLPATPTITASGPTTFCAGGSVTLTAPASSGYLWSNGALTQSINVTASGSYTVQVTNAAGCQSAVSAATTVTVNPAPATPIITASGPTTFCTGGSVTLTAPASSSYLWSNGALTQSINVTTSGSYTVQVTNAAGCQSAVSAATTVTVNPAPATPTITASGPTTFCAGGSVTLTAPASSSYLWSNGALTQSINVTTSGSYTVQVTSAAGCQSAVSAATTVTVNPAPATPTITASGPTTFCAGGSVTLTAPASSSYLWSNGALTQSINVTTSGSYTVQVTDATGCQSAVSSATTVTVNPAPATPTITASGPTTFCAGGSVTLTAPASSSYLWSNGALTQSIVVNTSGTYTVQVTNATGCQSAVSATTTVTVNPLPATPTITASGPTTFCAGGSVTLTAPASSGYLWSNGALTQSINVTTSGSYTVQVTDAAGCQSAVSTATTVTVNPAPATPTITASGPTTFCAGGSVTLTAPASSSYLWSNGALTQSIVVNTSGTYTVQVTNATGCQSAVSATTTVIVNPLPATPTISNSGPLNFCLGNSVTLTSSGGPNYLWSTTESTQAITVNSSGSYTVQVIDANGCISASSAPKNVTVNPIPSTPTISASGPTTFCAGGSVTLTSTAHTNYLWSNGLSTQSIVVTTSGNYSVQALNGAGCQSVPSNVISVTVNPLPATPVITASGPTTFCDGGSVTLTAPTSTSYLWSNGAITQAITVTTSGTFDVTVTDANGCTSATSAGVTVTVNPNPIAPAITAGGPTTFCADGSVDLTSTPGTTYLWSNSQNTATITVTTSGTYTAQVTNAFGCISPVSNSIAVTVNPLPTIPTISVSGATTFCTGGSVTLTAPAATSYLWSTNEVTQSIVVTTSGSYTVQVIDGNSCSSNSSAAVNVTVNPIPPTPTITAGGPTTFCAGGSVVLTSSATSGNTWSPGSELTQSITVSSSGTYTVTETQLGCTSAASAPITVTVNPLPATPTITAGGPTTFCAGGSVILTAPLATSYLWSTGAVTQSITVTASGSFNVTVTDANGCSSAPSASVSVTVNPLPATPIITASGPTTFCTGGSVVLTAPTSTSYLWSNGATTQAITVTTSGTFDVTVTDANGCNSSTSASVSVTVNPLPAAPTISASGATTFCAGGSVDLTSTAGTTYFWSNTQITQTITVTASGNYSAQITDANGCLSPISNTIAVTVNPLPATPVITASGTTTFCAGGSVTLIAPSGYSAYNWSNGANTQSIVVSASESLTVIVTDANGCNSLASAATVVTVNPIPPTPTITAGGPTTFCAGGSVVLTSSATSGNTWSPGSNLTQSITVSSSGTYTVTETQLGCTSAASAPITVTVNPLPATPTITAGGPTTFCAGGSVILTAPLATSYLWSTGAVTQSITVTASGSFDVTVTDANGCSSAPSASVSVTVNPLPATPVITASGPITFCDGGSVTLTAPTSTSYLWSTGAITQAITVTTSGTFDVTVTDANGCNSSTSASVSVTVNPLPAAPTISASGATTFCAGGSVDLTSTAGTTYLWSNTQSTQTITVTSSGTYTVQITDANGCTSSTSNAISVTVNPLPATPTIAVGGPTTFCDGSSVVLTAPAASSYLWSTSANTQSITVTAAGSYTVQVIDGNGCISSSSTAVNVTVNPIPPTPTITAGGATTFCAGGSVVLTSSATSGNTWTPGGALTQSITVSSTGTYTVTQTLLGCTSAASAPIAITVNPIPAAPTITAGGPTTFCVGSNVVLTSSASSGNTWSTSETSSSITVSSSGNYTVTQTVLGCTSPASAPINIVVNTIPAIPTITASGPTTFCAGGTVVLTSSSPTNNYWSNGLQTQSITVSASGTHVVQVITNGCASGTSAPVNVTVNALPPAPTIVTGTTESICAGASVVLTSSATSGNIWSLGSQNTQSITVSAAGSYTVTVTDANGCTSNPSIPTVVTVNPLPAAPIISANGPTSFCIGGEVTLTSSYSSNNVWSSSSTANSITVSANGTYTVTHTDANGCTSPASAPVTVTVNPTPAAPIITASGPTSFCSGGSVVLTSNQPMGNSWSNSSMNQSITISSSGVYSVIYIDGNGCASPSSSPVSVTVFANPAAPSISPSGPTTFCNGSNVTLTSSYTSGNSWNPGTAITQAITVNTSGTYTVTYTNANGCFATSAPIIVNVIPTSNIPTITANGPTSFCAGGNVILTSSDPNSTWSTGATSQSITVTTSGGYFVSGNQTGCPSANSAPVNVTVFAAPPAPSITPSGPTTICENEELYLFSSGTGTNTWSTGTIGPVIQATTSGIYTVTVANGSGCTATSAPINVTINPLPVVTLTPFTPLCSYASPFAITNGQPAGGSYTGDGITNNVFYPAQAGVGASLVTYEYTDVNGCTASAIDIIQVNDCAGIEENERFFAMYPNPTNGVFQVVSTNAPIDKIVIYDAQGKLIFVEGYHGVSQLSFDMTSYATGVYYVEIRSNDYIERSPLIINH